MKTFRDLKARDKIFFVYNDGTVYTEYIQHRFRECEHPRLYFRNDNWHCFWGDQIDQFIADDGYYVVCSCPEAIVKWLLKDES